MAPVDAVRLAAVLVLALATACGGAPRTPEQTVERYFAMLARDPMRTLDLLTPEFQRSHGLPPWRREDRAEYRARGASPPPPPSPEVAAEDGLVGWLAGQITPEVIERAERMRFRVEESRVGEASATVTVAVEPHQAAAFRQRFDLVRGGPAEPWRIERIAQEGGGGGAWNDLARYVAYPNEVLARRLRENPRGR